MLHTTITVDLPSEPYPTTGRVASLMRWVLLGPDPNEGKKRVTASGLVVVGLLLRAFKSAGFDDVISVLVDRKPVYIDTKEQLDDIEQALERTLECGALQEGLREVRLVLSQRAGGLHMLAEVAVDGSVLVEEHAVTVRLTTRIHELRIGKGEAPRSYVERVVDALDHGVFAEKIQQAEQIAKRLAEQLEAALGPVRLPEPMVKARVVVPGLRQLARFRHLGFGRQLRPQTYRAVAKDRRIGAYDDPHVYYYFDPYHDLLCWVLARRVLGGHWSADGLELLHPDGRSLWRDGAAELPDLPPELPLDAVELLEDHVQVADSVPPLGFDPAEAGSPHAPGWGGESS